MKPVAAMVMVSLAVTLAEAEEVPAPGVGARLKDHVRFLAGDALDGRFPGTAGGYRAAEYIAESLREAGVAPGMPTGSFLQPVPLVETLVDHATVGVDITTEEGPLSLPADQLVLRSERRGRRVEIAATLILAGYGIDAPRQGWQDFGAGDIAGSFVAVLAGLPDRAAERLPGGARAWAGRNEAKLAAARRRGAAGVLLLSGPDDDERFARRRPGEIATPFLQAAWEPDRPRMVVVVVGPAATERLLSASGTSYADLARRAADPSFEPLAPDVSLRLAFTQRTREVVAPNVVGRIAGSRPGTGVVVVTAHYDALGRGVPDDSGDTIYNGARDNASGTAGLIEIARQLAADPPPRTVVLVATTAEEADFDQIGGRYYVGHPVEPLVETRVAINLDGLGWRAPTTDFTVFPIGVTDAENTLQDLATPLGMTLRAADWHRGMHFSFDTVPFLARGIVGLTVWQGNRYRVDDPDNPPERLRRRVGIHAPDDEYQEDWSEAALEQHLALYLAVLRHYAGDAPAPRILDDGPFAPLIGR